MENKKRKPEKIEIDKEFLDDILKAIKDNADLIKKLEEARSDSVAPPAPDNQDDYIFQCVETMMIDKGATPQEIVDVRPRRIAFAKELETLMKKFRVISLSALFLKKL